MGDPDTHPTRSSVSLLTAVREWLWRHSSQPNGDPWDGDPEHLDRAAQRLLSELAQWLLATGSPTDSTEQDPERTWDHRDVASPTAALSASHRHPERGRRSSTGPSHTSTPTSTA